MKYMPGVREKDVAKIVINFALVFTPISTAWEISMKLIVEDK